MGIGVREIKGVTAEIAASLHTLGIDDSTQLLAAAGLPQARVELATKLGLDIGLVLELVKRADLARIHGLSCLYIDLLALAGVDTVTELRRRIPENLYVKLMTLAARQHVSQFVRLDEVQSWVSEAKQLERAVYH